MTLAQASKAGLEYTCSLSFCIYEAPHITEEMVVQGPDRKKVHEIHDSITDLLLSLVYSLFQAQDQGSLMTAMNSHSLGKTCAKYKCMHSCSSAVVESKGVKKL